MIDRLRDSKSWQLIIVTTLVLIVPLVVDIHGRVGVLQRMRREETRLNQVLVRMREERDALRSEFDQVNSPAYLERWARVDARIAYRNEVVVIPLQTGPTSTAASAQEEKAVAADSARSTAEQWHSLFFDTQLTP